MVSAFEQFENFVKIPTDEEFQAVLEELQLSPWPKNHRDIYDEFTFEYNYIVKVSLDRGISVDAKVYYMSDASIGLIHKGVMFDGPAEIRSVNCNPTFDASASIVKSFRAENLSNLYYSVAKLQGY